MRRTEARPDNALARQGAISRDAKQMKQNSTSRFNDTAVGSHLDLTK